MATQKKTFQRSVRSPRKKGAASSRRISSRKFLSPKTSRAKSKKVTSLKGGALPRIIQEGVPAPAAGFPESSGIPQGLPFSYNETLLVLLVRDPFWTYGYWDFSADTWNWIESLRRKDPQTRPKLRVHNLDRGGFLDLDVQLEAKNWYIELGIPDCPFEAELGLLDSQGQFHLIAKSNRVKTPRNGPSTKIAPDWSLTPEEFEEIHKLSGGGKTGSGSEFFSQFKRR